MRRAQLALLFALTVLVSTGSTRAGLDLTAPPLPAGTLELIVVEAEGCIYCGLFRRDVLPSYEASEQGRTMPVRFVDVNDIDAEHLNSPVDVVPTFIVARSQHEVGRISGYLGREDFFHSIDYLLNSAL